MVVISIIVTSTMYPTVNLIVKKHVKTNQANFLGKVNYSSSPNCFKRGASPDHSSMTQRGSPNGLGGFSSFPRNIWV